MINMPFVAKKYNRCITETDRQDQNINKYRIGICSKK